CEKENPSCCDNSACQWICSFPDTNIIHSGPLDFYDNAAKNTADNITVQSGSTNGEIVFPACRIFSAPKIDAEIISDAYSAAVVYITDTSGSMSGSMDSVKLALTAQMNNLNSFVNKDQKMIDAGKTISVGLVEFNSDADCHYDGPDLGFTFSDIVDIRSNLNTANLNSVINTYAADDCTDANPALVKAVSMLSGVSADKKIIVFLGDGASDSDPSTTAATAKAAKIEIYGIAYNGGPASICNWSSDNGANCWSGHYSYKSVDAASVYTAITNKIMSAPTGVVTITVKGKTSSFTVPPSKATDISLDLSGVTCSAAKQKVPFVFNYISGGGKIKFSNARVSVCDSCHAVVYGDGIIEPGEECDCGIGGVCTLVELNYKNCVSQGYGGGKLGCYPQGNSQEGQFDYSLCTSRTCVFDSSVFDSCSFASIAPPPLCYKNGPTKPCAAGSGVYSACTAFCALPGTCAGPGEFGVDSVWLTCWADGACFGSATGTLSDCVAPINSSYDCLCRCDICP
ncbi:MAG: VWA domain-containing protein, partial [bacterium]